MTTYPSERRRRLGLVLAAIAVTGALPAVMAPPLGWIVLHPVAWAPAFAVFARTRGRRAFLSGWLTGTIANLAVLYWVAPTVRQFSGLPPVVGVLALLVLAAANGLYAGVFALGFKVVRRASGSVWPIAIAAWFCACEFLNPQLFPYQQGVGWWEWTSVFLVVSLTGVAGMTFLVILANAVVLQAAETIAAQRTAGDRAAIEPTRWWTSPPARNAALLAVLVVAAAGWSRHRGAAIAEAQARVEPLRVALVQPNLDFDERRALRRRSLEAIASDLATLSREALAADPEIDVLVWPEKILPRPPSDRAHALVRRLAAEHGVELWTGASHFAAAAGAAPRERNSAFRVSSDGTVDPRRYDKNILVPFGEYTPFETLPVLRRISRGSFERGTNLLVYDQPVRFAFLICYEAILSRYVRRAVDRDAALLVNLTYDGWFGDTAEPHQHLMLAAIQSALYGVPLVRATTTGISALVDARGVVTARAGLFERVVVTADVHPVQVPSPYGAAGEWFAWTCVAVSALVLGVGLSCRAKRSPPAARSA